MSGRAGDGPATGPAGDRAGWPGRAPAAARSHPSDGATEPDGRQHTDPVPFPLPAPPDGGHRTEQPPVPLPLRLAEPTRHAPAAARLADSQIPDAQSSEAQHGEETRRLYLGGYPPRVPDAQPRPAALPDAAPDAESGAPGPGDD